MSGHGSAIRAAETTTFSNFVCSDVIFIGGINVIRKVNAQRFETAFYANPDLRGVKLPEEPKQAEPAALDLASLVEQLQQSPELAQVLASLISAQAGGR